MADLQEILGRIIRRERQGRDLTIKELGNKAGLSEIYVGEIERGQKYPSSKVLESLANALELDVADLLEFMAEEIRREREPQMHRVYHPNCSWSTQSPGSEENRQYAR